MTSTRVHGRVSFVIPTRNNARTIAACVASARLQGGDIEVIVVDNYSTDGTARIARRHGADHVVVAGPERSAQRNRGFDRSTGTIVAFIDSDMVCGDQLANALRELFRTTDVCAAVLPETAFGTGYLAACRALEKRLYLGDMSVEGARAFRHDVFEQAGGFDESLFGFEDYELTDRLRSAGLRIGRCSRGVRHDEGRVRLRQLWRKKRYYGSQWDVWTARQVDPRRLRRLPMRPAVLLADLFHLPGLVVLKVVDFSGLLAGLVAARRRRGSISTPADMSATTNTT